MDDGNGQFHLFPSLPEWGRSARVGKMASTGRCGGMFQPTNKRCDSERFLSIHKRRTLTSNGVARTNGFVSIFPSTLDYYRNMLMNPGSPRYPRLPDQVFLCACIWCTLFHFFSIPFSSGHDKDLWFFATGYISTNCIFFLFCMLHTSTTPGG